MRIGTVGTLGRVAMGFAISAIVATSLGAQRRPRQGWSPTLGAGVARAGLRGGGSAGAVHARFGLNRVVNDRVSTTISFDSYMTEYGVATPSCIPGGACQETSILPGMLLGTSGGLVLYPFGDALAFTGALGGYYGPSIRGSIPKGTLATTIGLDYELPWNSRFSPLISARFVYLTSPLANVRSLMGPSGGFGF
ncbi:MAG: hypothetical protein ABI877_05495 [Gemmatimonadaceae bacterium]